MRARPITTVGLAAALALSGLAFHLTPEGSTAATATRDGDTVAFSGLANLADPGVAEIPEFLLTEFADAAVADAAGIDLVTAAIEELDDASGLRFTWQMASDIPAEGVPEGVRYNWTFASGDQTFQLQAKRSNVASVTTAESPLDHAAEAAEGDWWFQLRGACAAAYGNEASPISGCYHLGFFDGSVDTAAGTVSMELPYGASDDIGRLVAGDFRRGQPITAQESAGSSIAAAFQAAVSNATVSQFLNGWGTYYPGTVVHVALGDVDGPTGSYALLDTPGDGSFNGELTGAGTYLWVKACSGYGVQGLDPEPCSTTSHLVG